MSSGKRYPLEYARVVAEGFAHEIAPLCKHVEIAGSIRRGLPEVGDVEVVCEPRLEVMQKDLFSSTRDVRGVALYNHLKRIDWISLRKGENGRPKAEGERYQALVDTCTGVPIDLFIVRPPAEWGFIMALRTGPAEFSASLMQAARRRGLRCEDGHLMRISTGEVLSTRDERAFFAALNLAWVEPEDRV
jgi:DNA polymerase/3'-5' exonuclease PolX